jgi:excisionase family DNA binding protein
LLSPLLLTPEQAAAELGIGRTRMYTLIAEGEVDSVKVGRSRRVPRQALVEYIDRLRGAKAVA